MSITTLKRCAIACALVAAAAGLSACGDGVTTYTAPDVPVQPPVTPPPVVTLGFIDFIIAKVATMLDTEEPSSIDALTATMPEDTEPVAVSL